MSARSDRQLDRREALRRVGGGALALASLPFSASWASPGDEGKEKGEKEKPRKRVLMYTRSQTFEHPAVKRDGNDLGLGEKILVDLGSRNGFDVKATKNGLLITEQNLAMFDAFVFYTSGVLTEKGGDNQPPMPPEGKKALLDAIAAGKGFIGIHSADDSFHSKGEQFENQDLAKRDPYLQMVGGEFIVHGEQQEAEMKIVSPRFPGVQGLGASFRMAEEWYTHKNFAPDLHVILVNETKGMKGKDYNRPPFPSTWARMHGKGRVFYTSLGHRDDVWKSETFHKILLGGIAWALGEVDADVTPNLTQVTPECAKLQPKE
jgi:uncharacterized protein